MGMKRFVIAVTTLAACAATYAGAATFAAASPPKAKLRAFLCQPARDPATRGISVTAVMRPLPHTVRLALRFQLFDRQKPGGPTSAVTGGDLGTWIYPKNKTLGQRPGDIWIVNHPVAQLSVAPAFYRFRVTFRWIGAHGHTLGTTVRVSPVCYQPELRPDLRVSAISVKSLPNAPNGTARDAYIALIRNTGASAAGPFTVQFTDGSVVRSKTVSLLGAHSKTMRTFVGPKCNAQAPPTVVVDPGGQVDDLNRSNNSLTAVCPGS